MHDMSFWGLLCTYNVCIYVCIYIYIYIYIHSICKSNHLGMKQLQSQAVAFGLIKSIIEKRLVCVEVYDVMEVISQHLVSVSLHVCANVCTSLCMCVYIHASRPCMYRASCMYTCMYALGVMSLKPAVSIFSVKLRSPHVSVHTCITLMISAPLVEVRCCQDDVHMCQDPAACILTYMNGHAQVTSQSEQMRSLCSQTLVIFLLDYPLGEMPYIYTHAQNTISLLLF
jgi:hypothetical protein